MTEMATTSRSLGQLSCQMFIIASTAIMVCTINDSGTVLNHFSESSVRRVCGF